MHDKYQDRRQAWAAYWSSGQLHSCPGSLPANQGSAVDDFWHGHFATLQPGSRVLDLASGNGPLPLLIRQMHAGAVEVDAVDLAPVAPAWVDAAARASVRFHPGIDMESLPFADASFDHIVSQFGFEYADHDRALSECLRVARPRASLAFVMHHADSVLVRVGREELRHHDLLQREDGLLVAARRVMPWIVRARAGLPLGADALQARAQYNRAMDGIGDAVAASSVPDLLIEIRERIHRLLMGGAGEAQARLEALQEIEASLRAARLRTAEMIGHALDEDRMARIEHRLLAARPALSIRCGELRQREGRLAWYLLAQVREGGPA